MVRDSTHRAQRGGDPPPFRSRSRLATNPTDENLQMSTHLVWAVQLGGCIFLASRSLRDFRYIGTKATWSIPLAQARDRYSLLVSNNDLFELCPLTLTADRVVEAMTMLVGEPSDVRPYVAGTGGTTSGGEVAVAVSDDRRATIAWCTRQGESLARYEYVPSPRNPLAWDETGTCCFVACMTRGPLLLFRKANGVVALKPPEELGGRVWAAAVNRARKTVAIATDSQLIIWDWGTRAVKRFDDEGGSSPAWGPPDEGLFFVSQGGRLKHFDAAGQVRTIIDIGATSVSAWSSPSVSADGRTVFVSLQSPSERPTGGHALHRFLLDRDVGAVRRVDPPVNQALWLGTPPPPQ